MECTIFLPLSIICLGVTLFSYTQHNLIVPEVHLSSILDGMCEHIQRKRVLFQLQINGKPGHSIWVPFVFLPIQYELYFRL